MYRLQEGDSILGKLEGDLKWNMTKQCLPACMLEIVCMLEIEAWCMPA